MFFIAYAVSRLSQAGGGGGAWDPPPCFWQNRLPYHNQGGKLYPPQYYKPPRIFRPCDGPVYVRIVRTLSWTLQDFVDCHVSLYLVIYLIRFSRIALLDLRYNLFHYVGVFLDVSQLIKRQRSFLN